MDNTIDQASVDADYITKRIREIVDALRPIDMSTDKVLIRVAETVAFSGLSRTSVLGSVLFAAIHAPVVGVSEEMLVGLVREVYAAMGAVASTAKAAELYKEANEAYHKEKAQFGSVGGIMVPGNDKVH